MGERVSDEITVDAPPEVIWEVITDLAAYPEWAEGVQRVEIRRTDDEGRPTEATFEVDARVAQLTYTLAYEYGPDRMAWTLVEADRLRQLDGEYVLEPLADGTTRLRYSLEVDLTIPVPGFLKKRAAKVILDTGLRGVKQRAEARV